MFDPNAVNAKKAEKIKKRKILESLKQKAILLIPPDLQEGLEGNQVSPALLSW